MTLNSFATRYGVSDRHARRLLADNEAELSGHFERRGGKATLIDEVAEEYLANQLRNPVSVLPDEAPAITEREGKLLLELANANARYADAERRAAENAEAAARLESAQRETKLLESFVKDAKTEIGVLNDEKRDLSLELGRERERVAQAEENAQKASQELLDARKQFEDEKHLLEQQIAGMKKASLWQRIRGWK